MNLSSEHGPGANADFPGRIPVSKLIRRFLRERKNASPEDVCEWLRQHDIHLERQVIEALLAAMKTG